MSATRDTTWPSRLLRAALSLALALALVPAVGAPASATSSAPEATVASTIASLDDICDAAASGAVSADDIIVVTDDDLSASGRSRVVDALAEEGLDVTDELSEGTSESCAAVLADVGEASVAEAIAAAEATDGVAWAQPNYTYKLLEDDTTDTDTTDTDTTDTDTTDTTDTDTTTTTETVPNDPAAATADTDTTANQYYIYGDETDTTGTIGANLTEAWSLSQTDGDVTIVVMDTGANLTHEDLSANILSSYCWDFYNDKKLKATSSFNGDYYGHGTHVCGIAAATANNSTGIAGTSYNANLIAYKIFDDSASDPSADTATLIEAYDQLLSVATANTDLNIRVVNLSLGAYEEDEDTPPGSSSDDSDEALEDAIVAAYDAGILSVCAGGNGDGSHPLTDTIIPADWDECLSVTALDVDGTNATWSDFNEYKDISAPGVAIYSTYNSSTSSYATESGTSMASPVVAGVMALLWAMCPDATISEVVNAVKETADDVDDTYDIYKRNSTGYAQSSGSGPRKTYTTIVSGSAGAINAGSAVSWLMSYWAETYCANGTHTGGTATCVAKAVCNVCGEEYGEIDSSGHSWDTSVVTKAATKTSLGIRTWTCSLCGATKTTTFKYTQTIKVAKKKKTVRASVLKRRKVVLRAVRAKGAATKVTYAKVSLRRNGKKPGACAKKVKVAKSNGKFTLARGLGKGTYKVKVKVTAAASSICTAASKTVTATIRVK